MNQIEKEGRAFFYQCIGSKLGVAEGAAVKSVQVPHAASKGVMPLALGQKTCFYIAMPGNSKLIGELVLEQDGLEVISPSATSARKLIATWLLDHAKAPYMVGVIRKAHPEPSFCVSHHPAVTTFCETGGNWRVNVDRARRAKEIYGDMDWRKTVWPAMGAYESFVHATQGAAQRERAALMKHLDKTPDLRQIVQALYGLGIRAGSGESRLLSWSNIDD